MEWIDYFVRWTVYFVRWLWHWSWVGKLMIIAAGLLLGSIFVTNKKAFLFIVVAFVVIVLGSFAINAWFTIGVPGL
ncbi:MAG: hypothetical protein GX133_06245 [Syntrophomonadaceae bacterium]|nr:hypothetical protein [Syntrophomonadaceae bacterium]